MQTILKKNSINTVAVVSGNNVVPTCNVGSALNHSSHINTNNAGSIGPYSNNYLTNA